MAPHSFGRPYPASAPILSSKLFKKTKSSWHILNASRHRVFSPGHPSPQSEGQENTGSQARTNVRTYTSEAPGEPPWLDALRRDRRPTAEPERSRITLSAGNRRR